MFNFEISELGKQDLREIWLYIAKNSPLHADKFIDTIFQKCQFLAENPQVGIKRKEIMKKLRSFPIKRYLIFYSLGENTIIVKRILHSSRDINLIDYF